ncbi:hypothetical protein ACRALDRAFT_2093633 [Sodiomyces alcalophilus JCM 7366]|uniref:uncharacterized protein n=1 Tax=Sodiomyces alcalophilus JCM 7366 TaxID=591952 RepID=UPI0039B392C1
MDDTSRSEYPAMLDHLQPGQAVTVLHDRLKRINKINLEIADWLQERRRVEEQYVQGLHRLMQFRVPNNQSDLGVFQAPWNKVIAAIEASAYSHHLLAGRIENEVEGPLRAFQSKSEALNIQATSENLTTLARDLEESQKKVEAQTKKAGKANMQKLDAAHSKLESATQQWESQAPFIFESLQAFDEHRINQLRDLLTQYQTYETEKAQRGQATAAETLAAMLEISTDLEIASFKERVVAGKPKLERRGTAPSRQGSSLATPQEDTVSEHSTPVESRQEPEPSKLRSKIGTMLGRRRQSTYAGFGPLSPNKGPGQFSRSNSGHGRLSPKASSSNLAESTGRLATLAETPGSPPREPQSPGGHKDERSHHEGTNGIGIGISNAQPHDAVPSDRGSSTAINGAANVSTKEVSPTSAQASQQNVPGSKDAEGFTIPPPANDVISQAQREAAEESEQPFKLNISSSPIAEEDPEASKAAISSVASTLTQMAAPSRRLGTVRGRRDVRNTIYFPSPVTSPELGSEQFPPSGFQPVTQSPRPPAVATLASEASVAGTSDTQSIRSANSFASLAHIRHPELAGPGLSCSIIETVSATFEDGAVKNAKIGGEIAFAYRRDEFDDRGEFPMPIKRETIRVNNFPNLEAIGPNRIFVHNVSPDRPDEFTLDLSHLHNKTSPAFTYRMHIPGGDPASLAEHAPLLMRPVWKPQGDKLGLLLQYSLNPAFRVPGPITLHNVVFVATYEGARASGAQTKPSGTHLKDRHLVYWRLGDVTLTSEPQKIVCRIIGAENAEPKPGHVEARWEYSPPEGTVVGSGISIATLEESKGKEKEKEKDESDDPFADESLASPALPDAQRWVDVSLVRKMVGGKYDAV